MGCCLPFRCPACAFEITVSGGPDMGMACYTQTIHCTQCEHVGDVVTLRFERGEWPAGERDPADVPPCPANASHDVVLWSKGGPCPKCGTAMAQGADSILWD
jgi:hypothetical protein